jgi:RHS repeat-associated protein
LYNVNGNTIYKHIFANGEPVADVQGSTTTAAVYYIHDDHLGGSSVISDASANVAEVMEYYPFGGTRFDQRSGSFAEQRRADGHEFDSGTGLLYEDARYLGPTLSRFLSEDPALITPSSGQCLDDLLRDPQKMNSYSYVEDNPLRFTDPNGREIFEAATVAGFTRGYGTHEFFYVAPEHPEDVTVPTRYSSPAPPPAWYC